MNETTHTERIVIAGAGYAGLHVALRLGSWLERFPQVELVLVDRHDYHQVLTELTRVASGTRSSSAVRVPLDTVLSPRTQFQKAAITGFDFSRSQLLTDRGPLPYSQLVLALGSKPNDFNIPGLAERVHYLWSVEDAERVRRAVIDMVEGATIVTDGSERRRLLTVVIGGGGATGVEMAGTLAEELPRLARRHNLPPEQCRVVLVEAGPTILAGASPKLIERAYRFLSDLNVDIRTDAAVVEATPQGFTLKNGDVVRGGVYIWAGGVQTPDVVQEASLRKGRTGRVLVDQYLRAVEHSNVYVAGDLAAVKDVHTGRELPPLAQVALEEGESVARNLQAVIAGGPLEPFDYHSKGLVVSVGGRRGVAEIMGTTVTGRIASVLKDTIEWEYRQSVKHMRGRSPV